MQSFLDAQFKTRIGYDGLLYVVAGDLINALCQSEVLAYYKQPIANTSIAILTMQIYALYGRSKTILILSIVLVIFLVFALQSFGTICKSSLHCEERAVD